MPSPESASTDWHFGLTDLATRTRSTSPRNFRTHRMGYSAQLPPDWSVSLEYRLQTLPPTQAPRLRPPLHRHSSTSPRLTPCNIVTYNSISGQSLLSIAAFCSTLSQNCHQE